MAKSSESVYRITELVGTSKKSWEDAARNAVETASQRCAICGWRK